MARRTRKDKKNQKKIARNRIDKLFSLAEMEAKKGRLKLADRYVELARKISMRYLVNIPREFKRKFCKNCYSYLVPSKTCRVRIKNGRLVIYCYNCKRYTRIPFS